MSQTPTSHILLAAGADARALRDRIVDLLADERAEISTDLTAFPDPADPTVALVVLSPHTLADPVVAAFAAEAVRRGFPLVPVVEDLGSYDFGSVAIPELSSRNAISWKPGRGQAILEAVRGHLGRTAFPYKKKVFLSYRRQDGEPIAQRIFKYLRRQGYEPFLDSLQIEAGAVVQPRIMQEIADKDFVLLLDTPLARQSDWVRAEIVEALNQRIPVRALAIDQEDPYPLLPDAERLTWKPRGRHMMRRVRDFVSRGIGATASFDVRCRNVLAGAAAAKNLRVEDRDRRRVVVSDGRRRAVVEWERALPTLERLHRLYKSYRDFSHGPAVLVSGDRVIPEPTAEAIAWARGKAPLQVVALHDVASLLDILFP